MTDWDRRLSALRRIEENTTLSAVPGDRHPCRRAPWSRWRWSHATCFWSRDAGCAEMIWCARRSTTCWPPDPATRSSCAPSGKTTPSCDRRDLVTIDSVRNHCERHFPVQHVARATYREILERRAQENQIDFVKGVATALLPMAFFERHDEKLSDPGRLGHQGRREHRHGRGGEAAVPARPGDHGSDLLALKVQLDQIRDAVVPCRRRCGARSSRSWRSWSSIRRRSMSARTPSMTLTTTLRPDRVHRRDDDEF